MRNCFTKITSVFRKKPIQQNQSENNRLYGEELLQPCGHCVGDNDKNIENTGALAATETTSTPTTIECVILNENSIKNDFDKHLRNYNKHDNKNYGDNNENNYKNVIWHREINDSVEDRRKNVVKTSNLKKNATADITNETDLDNNTLQLSETNNNANKNLIISLNERKEINSVLQQIETTSTKNISNTPKQKSEINTTKLQINEVTNTLDESNKQNKHTYIKEYKSFVEDNRKSFINSPLPSSLPRDIDFFASEEILKRPKTSINVRNSTERELLKLLKVKSSPPSTSYVVEVGNMPIMLNNKINEAKTPEEIEYDASVAAESEDVMTPLPTDTQTKNHHSFAVGRNFQPEIVEVIRSLDAKTLRINNLTLDDKLELLRRFENRCQHRRHSQGNGNILLLSTESNNEIVQQIQPLKDQQDDSSDLSEYSDVVLRRKVQNSIKKDLSRSNLYERRQPKGQKLKLILENKRSNISNETNPFTSCQKYNTESERNVFDTKYPTVLPPNPNLKALLVFHKTDNICEVMQQSCNRQNLDVTLVKSKESAMEILCSATECFHIIVVDARSAKHLDAEHIARSIRHMSGHHFTTIIAVVKKSISERDDVLNALLDAGVNRCMAESTNLSMCTMELKQTLHSIVRPHNVISTQQALYTALHRLKEVLIITDDLLRIQYANRSAERLLNMRLDEIINKPLAEIFVSDVSSINNNTGKGVREFDGILTVKRKNQDGIPMHVRVVPVACIGRIPTHFVFNFDVPGGQTDFIATLPQPKEAPRGSLHSIRRGSLDVRSIASDGLRRTSLAKLTSLPLEAPITKIINLLSQVQENCSADEARLIDKVMEFLKREGLYSPQMKEIRPDDPIATDLIGALLTGPNVYSSRRSSNDSIVKSGRPCYSTNTPGIMPAKMKATPLIMEILEESLNWEFNIFKLEEVTEKHPLLYLGMEIFRRFDVFSTLGVDETVCKNWLALMESHYHADNSYHNSTHAADVLQATGVFISQLAAKDLVMDRLEEATALIAAVAHDVDHPGRSSAFLCNSNSPLAILYNDLTVLESHHASTTFRLALADDNVNIFKNLDKDTYKLARSTIIDMILATEMTRHFEHLAKFVSVFGAEVEPRDIVQTEEESSILMRRMLIKVADVSNPARPMICCIEWARRIAEEYFTQTDEEKAKELPIVMPMFDRATCSIPKSQIGFIEYIIQDMMHAWDSFIDMPELITYMQINYSQWKKFEEQGIHTLAEIKAKQMSLMNKKTALK
ncbi:phosphodiesterase 8 isoform 2-T2 [Cochliomyia hominivorax]